MDWRLRWAIGVVALIGALAIGNAAATAGDMLPNGSGPLYGVAVVMGVIAGLCFWPWGRKAGSSSPPSRMQREGQEPLADDACSLELSPNEIAKAEEETSRPERARKFAIGMLLSGLGIAVLPFFGLTLDRMEDAPPIVIHLTGLAVMVIGAVALSFSFTHRGAAAGTLFAKVFLWSIIVLMVLVPVGAIVAVILGY